MNKNNITTELLVKDTKIGVLRLGNINYISLTDLANIKIPVTLLLL